MISADALTLSEAAAIVARATIVLSLTWLGARIAMRRSASTRHAVWAAGFIAALALPFAARAVPGWSLAVLPAEAVERTAPAADRIVAPPPASHSLPRHQCSCVADRKPALVANRSTRPGAAGWPT
jgi:hypothetical protein